MQLCGFIKYRKNFKKRGLKVSRKTLENGGIYYKIPN